MGNELAIDLNQNVGIGTAALLCNTTGFGNTAVGDTAMRNNTYGFNNTAVGCYALRNNTTGIDNVAVGRVALRLNTTGLDGGSNSRKALKKRISTWPTPTTPTGGGNIGGSGAYKNAIKNGTHIPHSINPNLYEWLMGWPIGWTDLKPLAMGKWPFVPQQHGES